MKSEVYQLLQNYWRYSEFRYPQFEIIENVLKKKDTIALLPTGGGKSLCYQLPSLVFSGKTIVVTPLIALMEDQVRSLQAMGIKAVAIHGNLSFRKLDRQLDNFMFGDTKIIFISPERIQTDLFRERYKRTKVDLVAIDEAHCISQWGYDFRPSYMNISLLREWKKDVVFLALTATATSDVLKDIREKLQLDNPVIFRKSYFRENIGFYVVETGDKKGDIFNILKKITSSSIVYVRNRRETQEISAWLNANGISALPYHGGMDYSQREHHQNSWMENNVQVIVCTNAFGMGIDKPDVRCVIHMDIPASLEEYFQEAGRAGRDGNLSRAFLLYDKSDIDDAKIRWTEQFPEISAIGHVFDQLCRYFKVAFGSGPGESYLFRIQDFARQINISVKHVFQILQILEREGWIELSDGFSEPTRVQIVMDRQSLYDPGMLTQSEDEILTHLLRKYEGVFTIPVKVDEYTLSRELEMDEKTLLDYLGKLEAREILSISWKRNEPFLSFLKERPQEHHFSMDKKQYILLKNNAAKRLEAMINYVTQHTECRQHIVLNYFDENIDPCQKCDICLTKNIKDTVDSLKSNILTLLQKNQSDRKSIQVKDLFLHYPLLYRKLLKETLVHLENEQLIRIRPSGLIQLLN